MSSWLSCAVRKSSCLMIYSVMLEGIFVIVPMKLKHWMFTPILVWCGKMSSFYSVQPWNQTVTALWRICRTDTFWTWSASLSHCLSKKCFWWGWGKKGIEICEIPMKCFSSWETIKCCALPLSHIDVTTAQRCLEDFWIGVYLDS